MGLPLPCYWQREAVGAEKGGEVTLAFKLVLLPGGREDTTYQVPGTTADTLDRHFVTTCRCICHSTV